MSVLGDAGTRISTKIEWIRVSDVQTDRAVNTRPINLPWVVARKDRFDVSQLGVPTVSKREDGTLIWLDGQHRAALMNLVGWNDQQIEMKVFEGLTIQEEASLFLALNDSRRVGAIYRFLAGVTAGSEIPTEIFEVVTEKGWHFADKRADRVIMAVRSLEGVYQGNKYIQKGGIKGKEAVSIVLTAVTTAWGYRPDGVNGEVILGLGYLLHRYGELLNVNELTLKLSSYPGGPSGLLGDARGRRGFSGGSVAYNVAEVVRGLYNRGRRTRHLPSFLKAA